MSFDAENPTKRQLIAICNRAKKELWDGKGSDFDRPTYVCYALSRASRLLYGGRRPYKLTEMVDWHIGDHGYMEDFLTEKFGEQRVAEASKEEIQRWRFMMLDNIIKLLKEGK